MHRVSSTPSLPAAGVLPGAPERKVPGKPWPPSRWRGLAFRAWGVLGFRAFGLGFRGFRV